MRNAVMQVRICFWALQAPYTQPCPEFQGSWKSNNALLPHICNYAHRLQGCCWVLHCRYFMRQDDVIHTVCLQVLHQNPGGYLQQRKHLIALVLHYAGMLRMSQEVAHTAAALMDRVVMSGVHMTEQFQLLFVCACLRLAAIQEQAPVPSPAAITQLTDYSGAHLLPLTAVTDQLRWAAVLGQVHFAIGHRGRAAQRWH